MLIGAPNSYNFFNVTDASATAGNVAPSATDAEKFALTNTAILPVQPISAIARKYDLRDISAREIDEFAQELKDAGLLTDAEHQSLLTFGAEYLSSMRGSFYSEDALTEKRNLLDDIGVSMEMTSANPAASAQQERLLSMLKRLENTMPTNSTNGETLQKVRIADKTLAELMLTQEVIEENV